MDIPDDGENQHHPIGDLASHLSNGNEVGLGELRAWGVDLSLIEASLARTPTERVCKMLMLRRFGQELGRAYRARVEEPAPACRIGDE
ncbi:MAG: hypothetical protein M3Z66_11745 [Chloroflexota bacterium]|nr:hypothetical protein [Chloroflexota bacterium]